MNVVEIIALIIIASMIYDGFRIGFVKTIFKIIRSLIGIAVAVFACSLLMNKVPMGLKYVVPGVFFALIGIVFAVLGILLQNGSRHIVRIEVEIMLIWLTIYC